MVFKAYPKTPHIRRIEKMAKMVSILVSGMYSNIVTIVQIAQ